MKKILIFSCIYLCLDPGAPSDRRGRLDQPGAGRTCAETGAQARAQAETRAGFPINRRLIHPILDLFL